jgi:hypothetical protein
VALLRHGSLQSTLFVWHCFPPSCYIESIMCRWLGSWPASSSTAAPVWSTGVSICAPQASGRHMTGVFWSETGLQDSQQTLVHSRPRRVSRARICCHTGRRCCTTCRGFGGCGAACAGSQACAGGPAQRHPPLVCCQRLGAGAGGCCRRCAGALAGEHCYRNFGLSRRSPTSGTHRWHWKWHPCLPRESG